MVAPRHVTPCYFVVLSVKWKPRGTERCAAYNGYPITQKPFLPRLPASCDSVMCFVYRRYFYPFWHILYIVYVYVRRCVVGCLCPGAKYVPSVHSPCIVRNRIYYLFILWICIRRWAIYTTMRRHPHDVDVAQAGWGVCIVYGRVMGVECGGKWERGQEKE